MRQPEFAPYPKDPLFSHLCSPIVRETLSTLPDEAVEDVELFATADRWAGVVLMCQWSGVFAVRVSAELVPFAKACTSSWDLPLLVAYPCPLLSILCRSFPGPWPRSGDKTEKIERKLELLEREEEMIKEEEAVRGCPGSAACHQLFFHCCCGIDAGARGEAAVGIGRLRHTFAFHWYVDKHHSSLRLMHPWLSFLVCRLLRSCR